MGMEAKKTMISDENRQINLEVETFTLQGIVAAENTLNLEQSDAIGKIIVRKFGGDAKFSIAINHDGRRYNIEIHHPLELSFTCTINEFAREIQQIHKNVFLSKP